MSLLSLFGQAPNYDYQTMYEANSSAQVNEAGLAVIGIIWTVAVVVGYIITALCLSRIFKKAGVEGWKAWVPIYNTWVMLELGGQQGFWAVLLLLPIINIVSAIFIWIAMYNIGLNFGKSSAFVLLAIFLPLIWVIWLAVDKSTWQGGAPAAPQPAAPTPKDKGTAPPITS